MSQKTNVSPVKLSGIFKDDSVIRLIGRLLWRYNYSVRTQSREHFFVTLRELCDDTSTSKNTLIKNLRFLESIGLIKRGRYLHGKQNELIPSEFKGNNKGRVTVILFSDVNYQELLKFHIIEKVKTMSEFFELAEKNGRVDLFQDYLFDDSTIIDKYFLTKVHGSNLTHESESYGSNLTHETNSLLYTTITTIKPSTTFLLSEFENEAPDETQMNHEDEDFSLKNTSGKKLADPDFFVVENESDGLACVYQFMYHEEINESRVSSEYELKYETPDFLKDGARMGSGSIQVTDESSAVVGDKERNISSAKKNLPVSTDSFEYKCAEFIWDQVLKQYDKAKKPDLNRWAKEVSKMIRIDKRDEGEIRRILKFIYSPGGDQFWQTVIQSPTGLRRNFDKIAIKANNASKQPQNQFHGSGGGKVFYTAKEQEEMRYQEKRRALYANWEAQKNDPNYVRVEPLFLGFADE